MWVPCESGGDDEEAGVRDCVFTGDEVEGRYGEGFAGCVYIVSRMVDERSNGVSIFSFGR